MLKYLLLLILALVVWWAWKKRAELPPAAETPPPLPERMVRCAHCGVHLPESDALADGDRHFCNEAHRRAAQTAGK
ncbi:PP0621 family protein [Azonexus hydrophilus]|nr:PP0621 family protein [Azonexus hydrophilus]